MSNKIFNQLKELDQLTKELLQAPSDHWRSSVANEQELKDAAKEYYAQFRKMYFQRLDMNDKFEPVLEKTLQIEIKLLKEELKPLTK